MLKLTQVFQSIFYYMERVIHNMKNFSKKSAGLFLIIVAFLLSACSKPGQGADSTKADLLEDGSSQGQKAMGRYVETQLPLPETLKSILGFHSYKNGDLGILCFTFSKEASLQFFISKDHGKSWDSQTPAWLTELLYSHQNYDSIMPAWDKNDSMFLAYTLSPADAPYGSSTGQIASVNEDGSLTIRFEDVDLYNTEDGSGATSFHIADNGDFIFGCHFSILHLDGSTGKIRHTFLPKYGDTLYNYTTTEDTLVVSDGSHIVLYSLEDSQMEEDIPLSDGSVLKTDSSSSSHGNMEFGNSNINQRVIAQDEKGKLFFADANGIFQFPLDNSMLEKIVDGSLNSLGTPAFYKSNLVINPDGFLVLGYIENDYSYALYSYAYDPDTPTVPDTELTIYSLTDNPTIRQAAGIFQMQNPEVYVNYQVGMSDSSGTTASDALRSLTTQLLAGDGPDLLVLDGLPVTSYIEKGVLMDLSESFQQDVNGGSLFRNVAEAYLQKNGALYAIPARFHVPLMLGAKEIQSIDSLSALVSWCSSQEEFYDHPLAYTSPRLLLEEFYPLCEAELIKEGSLDKTCLASFLSDIKAIQDLKTSAYTFEDDGTTESQINFDFNSLLWLNNGISLNIGTIHSLTDTFAAYQALEEKEGILAPLLHKNVFLPSTILGITSGSPQKDTAKKFIRCTLSYDVLKYDLGDGLPTSMETFEKALAGYTEGDRFSYYGMGYRDRNGQEVSAQLNIFYPKTSSLTDLSALLQTLTPVSYVDPAILKIIKEESQSYFNGKAELSAVLDGISRKVNLYMQEQQ